MTPEEIMHRLAEPFDAGEVKWKPQSVKGNRALAVCYIDCRLVQDRLDDVLGVGNWMDEYQIVADGSVVCQLRAKIDGEWITKTDVGSPSEQPDGGDRLKAAFSDALKRAAVKFGIGRYLYRLGHQWCDYDVAKKQFAVRPKLPNWALPGPVTHHATLPAKDPYPELPPADPIPPRQPAALPAKTTQPQQNPLWDDDDAFFDRLKVKGSTWPNVVKWLNDKKGGKYKPDSGFWDVSPEHRQAAVEALMGGPK